MFKNSLILEIGSNDGTFLKNFNKKKHLGMNHQEVFILQQNIVELVVLIGFLI